MSRIPIRTKPERQEVPCALTIAGSDSGGGAGVQADLKTFAALGVHGTSAVTSITGQNPDRVSAVEGLSPQIVREQIEMAVQGFSPKAVKTGMLYNRDIIRTVSESLKKLAVPIIVDPVMIATSGAVLLEKSAVQEMLVSLLPRARLLTPNLPEAEALLKKKLEEPEDMRAAARTLCSRYGCAILVKGGHLKGTSRAIDIFYDGNSELLLETERVRGVFTHGTGCTYSAAITGYVARGEKLSDAVIRAKEFISNAIAKSWRCGRHDVLNSFWNRQAS